MRILFVCRYNRFRSKIAEAIFNSLNKNKKIKAESAGFTIDENHLYIEPLVIALMKEKGYSFRNLKSQTSIQLTKELAEKFDLIVISANNVPKEFFHDIRGYPKSVIKWDIHDCLPTDIKGIRFTIVEIEKKVKELVKHLNTL